MNPLSFGDGNSLGKDAFAGQRKEYEESKNKLLPCPFCKGKAKGPTSTNGTDERNGYNFQVRISCSVCPASMEVNSHEGKGGWCDDTGQAMQQAIAAWNRRTV